MVDRQRVIAIMDDEVRPGGPGMAYIVTGVAGPVFERARGLADIAGRIPMTPATTIAAFSMTKTLTCEMRRSHKERKPPRG